MENIRESGINIFRYIFNIVRNIMKKISTKVLFAANYLFRIVCPFRPYTTIVMLPQRIKMFIKTLKHSTKFST